MGINILLTKEESLILFEFLSRINENNYKDLFINKAEQNVLWNLESILEKELDEPFSPKYKKILEMAYKNLIQRNTE